MPTPDSTQPPANTSTPWYVEQHKQFEGVASVFYGTGGSRRCIARNIGKENAALIVLAVNQHAALVALAEKWLDQYVETSEGLDPEEKAEVEADHAIIAAAKQGGAQ